MKNTYKGILHCYFYRITGKELLSLLEDRNKYGEDTFTKYILEEADGELKVQYLDYYQFCEEADELTLLDVETSDYILKEELSRADLTDYEMTIDSLEGIIINEKLSRCIPIPTLCSMSVDYYQDYFGESDMEVSFEMIRRS